MSPRQRRLRYQYVAVYADAPETEITVVRGPFIPNVALIRASFLRLQSTRRVERNPVPAACPDTASKPDNPFNADSGTTLNNDIPVSRRDSDED